MAASDNQCNNFSCPFDGEARERIAILETEQRHTRETQDQMLDELRAIRLDMSQVSRTLLEASTKWNTTASVGFTALSLWTRAVVMILGGIGTLFGAAWAVGQVFGIKVVVP